MGNRNDKVVNCCLVLVVECVWCIGVSGVVVSKDVVGVWCGLCEGLLE